MKNLATDFTNSRGFIKKFAKISEIRGKKSIPKNIAIDTTINMGEVSNQKTT